MLPRKKQGGVKPRPAMLFYSIPDARSAGCTHRSVQNAFLIHVAVTVHGELIHRIILEVGKNLTAVSLLDEAFTRALDLHLGSVSGRTADAAAFRVFLQASPPAT